jgi:ubiquinone biosynthesis protein UbiJ
MSTREAAYALLEQALNGCLALDPEAGRRLRPLSGRVIRVQLTGAGLTFWLAPGEQGIQVFPQLEGPADCTLIGSPAALARLGRERGSDVLFRGEVRIQGDTEVAHQFGAALAALDLDWEEPLARLLGDPLAHQTGRTLRAGAGWARAAGVTLLRDLEEYLVEEARLLPACPLFQDWREQVETLRDDVERLAARVRRLQRRLD